MSNQKIDWEITRPRHVHFTDDELRFIRDCYGKKLRPAYVAKELKCSIRSVHKHYSDLRNGY